MIMQRSRQGLRKRTVQLVLNLHDGAVLCGLASGAGAAAVTCAGQVYGAQYRNLVGLNVSQAGERITNPAAFPFGLVVLCLP